MWLKGMKMADKANAFPTPTLAQSEPKWSFIGKPSSISYVQAMVIPLPLGVAMSRPRDVLYCYISYRGYCSWLESRDAGKHLYKCTSKWTKFWFIWSKTAIVPVLSFVLCTVCEVGFKQKWFVSKIQWANRFFLSTEHVLKDSHYIWSSRHRGSAQLILIFISVMRSPLTYDCWSSQAHFWAHILFNIICLEHMSSWHSSEVREGVTENKITLPHTGQLEKTQGKK